MTPKRRLLGLLIVMLGFGLLAVGRQAFRRPESVHLAVVAPLSGPSKATGQRILRGIELYVREKNAAGGLAGKPIVLDVFDDSDNKQQAMKIALDQIVVQDQALLVLGHNLSATSLAAGEIYKTYGIPAITASATAEALTHHNDWYFQMIPDNVRIAEFSAHYLTTLGVTSASLIFDQDSYGVSLAEAFEKASRSLNLTLTHTWSFDTEAAARDQQFAQIIAELRALPVPGAIFFATQGAEAVKIITSVKRPGVNYLMLGADAFATHSFIEQFRQYPLERAHPGYYSDDIYAIAPFLPDLANEAGANFRQAYLNAYRQEPSWESASYYDAAHWAVEALERVELQGMIKEDRRRIRDRLRQYAKQGFAFQGVAGDLYFTPTGSVNKALALGRWQHAQLLPAFTQYETLSDEQKYTLLTSPKTTAETITIGDQPLHKMQVIYVGIDLNEVSNLNMQTHTYTLDFYLWFRFEGDFPDHLIEFRNAVTPLQLGPPLIESRRDGVTTRTYRVKGDFKSEFQFQNYPFDQQQLLMSFHHSTRTCDKMIYVQDVLGMAEAHTRPTVGAIAIHAMTGWHVKEIWGYQDIAMKAKKVANLNYTLAYPGFNAIIRIKRAGQSVAVKTFFPFILLASLLSFVSFLPVERLGLRMLVILTVLVMNSTYAAALLLKFAPQRQLTIMALVMAVYGFSLLAAGISWWGWALKKRHQTRGLMILQRLAFMLYPMLAAVAVLMLIYQYHVAL